jgi:DNA-binding MarR family transcriptional regulator
LDNKYQIVKQLVDKLAEYEAVHGSCADLTLSSFTDFLANRVPEPAQPMRRMGGPNEKQMQRDGEKKETSIAILVTFIYRYAKVYARKVLSDSPLSTLDDFSYLITLLTHDSLSKSELIQHQVHEKTTGMEILKRLLRQGLICQFDDTEDRRSQRVAITSQGRMAVFSVLQQLDGVTTLMTGNLSSQEKEVLYAILSKLDHFHYDIFTHDKALSMDEILNRRMPSVN